eukprot:6182967-Pleurochrysis_carterae.AAC.4
MALHGSGDHSHPRPEQTILAGCHSPIREGMRGGIGNDVRAEERLPVSLRCEHGVTGYGLRSSPPPPSLSLPGSLFHPSVRAHTLIHKRA